MTSPLGYTDYGQARMPIVPGVRRGLPSNPSGIADNVYANVPMPVLGAPQVTLGWPANGQVPAHRPVTPTDVRRGIVSTGSGAVGSGGRVESATPQSRALGLLAPMLAGAMLPGNYGTRRANVNNPLYGRPGFSYVYANPSARMGPAFKGAPGTGRTNPLGYSDRSRGFQPSGYAGEQHMPLQQFDYTPPTDPTFDIGLAQAARGVPHKVIPRSIGVGTDGVTLVGTYRAHDSTPADRFFKQGRSSANWQDMSFGPAYRWLTPYQQVARYNLYNSIAPSRPLSPNAYFLGYQTQAGVASMIGGVVGQGRPLGY